MKTLLLDRFETLRLREFSRLDRAGHVYLDHTGSALYPESLVLRHAQDLRTAVLGNPHSENPAALASTKRVEHARAELLRFLDADPAEYAVCFTANASAALKLVGESFPFGPGSRFVLTRDNHNSVNGIRQFARRRGARVTYLPLDDELRLLEPARRLPRVTGRAPSLFAFPAQSNFSGVKHSLELVGVAQQRGYTVLLDAAAFLPAHRLSLRDVQPDFLALSFYKMFGYPTGTGALVARRSALTQLARPWFAGGTVDLVSTLVPLHILRAGEFAFEDGTADFLSLAAVPAGLAFLEGLGMDHIRAHVGQLTERLLEGLRPLQSQGARAGVYLYGPDGVHERGGTIAFNVLDSTGRVRPFDEVVQAAAQRGISLRGGCFCNPGASEAAFHYTRGQWQDCLASTAADLTYERFVKCLGNTAVGAVRASLGLSSNSADVDAFITFLGDFAQDHGPRPHAHRILPAELPGWGVDDAVIPRPHYSQGISRAVWRVLDCSI